MKKKLVLLLALILVISASACNFASNHKHAEEIYVPPEETENFSTYTGVFRLDTSRWSDESMHDLFHGHNDSSNDEQAHDHEHSVHLSIAPDGTAYLQCGENITKGSALIYYQPESIPDDENMYKITFGSKACSGNLEDQVLTVDDMNEYTDINDMQGTTWIFIYESNNWWTEESLSGNGQ